MTFECLFRVPFAWYHFLSLVLKHRPNIIYLASHHEIILLLPLLLSMRRRVVCHMHDPPSAVSFQLWSFKIWRVAVGRFLFISQSARHRLSLLGPLHDRDAVIYNGVEVHPIRLPRVRDGRFVGQFDWPLDCVVVGMTGQMLRDKGGEDFLVAADAVRKQSPDVRFVIGGPAEGAHYEMLRLLIKRLGMEGLVGFPGWLWSSRDFFSAIDVLVVASRHEEGFGLVAAEASERGIPVVATRSGGVTEIVIDKKTGFIVDRNDPAALADGISALVQDSGLRSSLGRAGRQRIAEKFNLVTQASAFEELLRERVDI
jgi:glycosyltransferase involved in cell wall biosynthesis